jgi:hypothetical protein
VPAGMVILPVFITAVTGVVYAPVVYGWIGRSVDRERAILHAGASDVAPAG